MRELEAILTVFVVLATSILAWFVLVLLIVWWIG